MGLYRGLDGGIQFDFMVDTHAALPEFDEIRAGGGRVFRMGRYLDAPWGYQRMIHDVLDRHGDEYIAVHSHDVIRALPLLWAARRYGVSRRILHSHTDSLEGSPKALVAAPIAAVTVPLATDLWACSEAAGRFFFGRRRFEVFPNAIPSERFLFRPEDRARIRRRLGIGRDTLVIGHTGRFTYQKNHDWLIRVFAEVRRWRSDARLILVGEGPLETASRALAETLGVAEAVHFVGLQPEVGPFLSAMDLFLLPSHFEGFGISLLEAQANGLPCLASTVIRKEVRVTPGIELCRLDDPLDLWRDGLLSLHERGRGDSVANVARIRRAGYDLDNQLTRLLAMYR
ncbi:MAG: glycosyltransferase [Candidatus Thiosymbion ectosymbiont of Robbea hypermnestra]|nr:glycosyltransferase [Candidatus Thiosymbion ectosymbiont of Robbea hypermnestra]